jgi:hypothetical protein
MLVSGGGMGRGIAVRSCLLNELVVTDGRKALQVDADARLTRQRIVTTISCQSNKMDSMVSWLGWRGCLASVLSKQEGV